ncbi:hypothetical protein DPMN_176508 [Dreissena polymorpha]|uniref:Uncharacterized protein n=1 Tax=Dreissena polymorpha TaxID=45954 RepID=A0A9D4E8E7_DREPO|nr:hypothetical protein DPMN_176508 [Dreissena polymorpha]
MFKKLCEWNSKPTPHMRLLASHRSSWQTVQWFLERNHNMQYRKMSNCWSLVELDQLHCVQCDLCWRHAYEE